MAASSGSGGGGGHQGTKCFRDFNEISRETAEVLSRGGFERASPVQEATIPLLLSHKDVSVEAAPDCCAACAELAECASWELRGASKCILRSAPPGVGEPGPTSCVSNALAAPPPPAPPPPLPFVPTNNGNRFGVCKIVVLFSILSRCPSR